MAKNPSDVLVRDLLNLIENDSANLERTMTYLAKDCVWVMEPGGVEYHSSEEIKTFIGIAMSGRTHDKPRHRIEITKWIANAEKMCLEYTHGAVATGKFTFGFKGKVKTGVLRYYITDHLQDVGIDRVHEYIDSTSWWMTFFADRSRKLT